MKFYNYYFNHRVINLRFIAIKSTLLKSYRFKKESQLLCCYHLTQFDTSFVSGDEFGKFYCTVYRYIMQMVSSGVKQIAYAVVFFAWVWLIVGLSQASQIHKVIFVQNASATLF